MGRQKIHRDGLRPVLAATGIFALADEPAPRSVLAPQAGSIDKSAADKHAAELKLEAEFRSARPTSAAACSPIEAERAEAVHQLRDFPVVSAARLVLTTAIADPAELVRKAAFGTLECPMTPASWSLVIC